MLARQAGDARGCTDAMFPVAAGAPCGNFSTFLVGDITGCFNRSRWKRRQAGKISRHVPDIRFSGFGNQLLQRIMAPSAVTIGMHGIGQVIGRLTRQVGDFGGFSAPVRVMATGTVILRECFSGFDVDNGPQRLALFRASSQNQ